MQTDKISPELVPPSNLGIDFKTALSSKLKNVVLTNEVTNQVSN